MAEMTKAESAVTYVLRRVLTDVDFRWHMMWTEALSLLLKAEAERLGRDAEEFREEFYDKAAKADKSQGAAELPTLRKKCEQLESKSPPREQAPAEIPPERRPRNPYTFVHLPPSEYLEATWR